MNRRLAFALSNRWWRNGRARRELALGGRPAALAWCRRARQRRARRLRACPRSCPWSAPPATSPSLVWLYAAVLGIEAALALAVQEPASPASGSSLAPAELAAAACIAALALLAIAPLGLGALLTLMLYAGARAAAGSDADMSWAMTLVLGAVSTALLLDLALVALGLQRSSLWLALGAAVGMALATRQALAATDAKTRGDVGRSLEPAATDAIPARAGVRLPAGSRSGALRGAARARAGLAPARRRGRLSHGAVPGLGAAASRLHRSRPCDDAPGRIVSLSCCSSPGRCPPPG